MDARDERLARNQTIFREVNERVAELAQGQLGAEPLEYQFFCECSDTSCVDRLELTLGEYESLRATSTWFVIAHGHEYPQIEQTIRASDGYQIVQKLGEAGEVVAASDARD